MQYELHIAVDRHIKDMYWLTVTHFYFAYFISLEFYVTIRVDDAYTSS